MATEIHTPEPIAAVDQATAVLYLRVSTDRQVRKDYDPEGYSIPSQREAGERRAEALVSTVVRCYTEYGETGRNTRRPALQLMLAELATGEKRAAYLPASPPSDLSEGWTVDPERGAGRPSLELRAPLSPSRRRQGRRARTYGPLGTGTSAVWTASPHSNCGVTLAVFLRTSSPICRIAASF